MSVQTLTKEEKAQKVIRNPRLIRRELNNRSLYEFLKWAWPEVSGHKFVENWHLEYLSKELEQIAHDVGNGRKKKHDLLINISPGTTKTILCSIVFPVWCWTQWYWMRIITASYSSALSLESAEASRDLVKSNLFKEIYPELEIKQDKDTKSNYKIIKKVPGANGKMKILSGGYRFSTSVGGSLVGFHGDINIWDDPINPQQSFSENQLEIANRWIDQTLSTRKTDKEVSVTIGIMQRLHENDPSGHLLAKKKENLKHICLPGQIRDYGRFVKPKEALAYYKDDLFDINRMNWDVLADLEKDLGQYGFAGQIGQNPAPPGGGMFQVEHLGQTSQIFDSNEYEKIVRYWDKAGTAKKRAAYSVGVKMIKLRNGKYLIDDVKRGKWNADKREAIIRQTAEIDGPKCHVIVEQEPGSGGKESAQGTIRNLAGFMVFKDRPTGDKGDRADPYSVQVNNGNVILRTADWNYDYKEELRSYPFATYKDQVDASSGAFNYLVKKKKVRRLI
ncbi:MAG: phage terminase large subunit [bacterium]